MEELGKPIEILLVEDNPGDVELRLEALKEAKVPNNVTVVMDGLDAMDLLLKQGKYLNATSPDLIFLDLNLPRKNGCEILIEIKETPSLKMIPVIIMTTSKDELDISRAYDAHANCYITKPIDFDKFFEIFKSIENLWFNFVKFPTVIDNVKLVSPGK